MENVKKFYEELKSNEELREKAKAIGEKHKESASVSGISEGFAQDFAELARSQGFDFTAQDLKDYAKAPRELSSEELENISGGRNYDPWHPVCAAFGCLICACWPGNPDKSSRGSGTCSNPWYR